MLTAAKKKARDALWRRGILSWKLRPEQKLLLAMLKLVGTVLAVFNISRRFGKTTTCVIFCIEEAIKRKQDIRYATAFLSDLQSFLHPIFDWALSDCPEDIRPKWVAYKKSYVFKNGSTIKLIGVDKNPDGLRGGAIDILVYDESSFSKKLQYIYESIIIPATMERKFKLIFPSTPPISPLHFWAANLIPKAKKSNTYVELTIDAISSLSPAEKQRVLDEVGGPLSPTAQREFYCKLKVDQTRAVAPYFVGETHVGEHEAQYAFWQFGGDAGGIKDKTVLHRYYWNHDLKKIVFTDEIVFAKNTATDEMLPVILERFGEVSLVYDASGQTRIDFDKAGLSTIFPKKTDLENMVKDLNDHLYRDEILVTPNCPLLIATLEGGLLNATRTDFERTPELGHCDAVASAVYCIRNINKNIDLRPKKRPSVAASTEAKRKASAQEVEDFWEKMETEQRRERLETESDDGWAD